VGVWGRGLPGLGLSRVCVHDGVESRVFVMRWMVVWHGCVRVLRCVWLEAIRDGLCEGSLRCDCMDWR
jgi:hypothetical protein